MNEPRTPAPRTSLRRAAAPTAAGVLLLTLGPPACRSHHHSFDDAERWAARFEAADRDEWQKPDVVVRALKLTPGARVADIGSATGYFPVRVARVVPMGRVWGVDVEPDMVRYLNLRARREGIPNLFSVLGRPDDPLLPEPVDLVMVVDTYHHIEDRAAYFTKVRSSLRPGGRVAIIDFRKGDIPVGPPDAMKISPEQVRQEMEQAGYRLTETIDELPYQYFLIFSPRTQPEAARIDPEKERRMAELQARAATVVEAYQTHLMRELQAAIAAGGPANAVEVCSTKAPEIAAELSTEGLQVRRIGTRVRNTTAGTPTEDQARLLSSLTREAPEVVAEADGRLTYLRAIHIASPMCLQCHGSPEAIAPAVKEKLAQLYPGDQAVGYQLGDLRGAFVVTGP